MMSVAGGSTENSQLRVESIINTCHLLACQIIAAANSECVQSRVRCAALVLVAAVPHHPRVDLEHMAVRGLDVRLRDLLPLRFRRPLELFHRFRLFATHFLTPLVEHVLDDAQIRRVRSSPSLHIDWMPSKRHAVERAARRHASPISGRS